MMNIKTLSSGIAAAALVSAIGLAYAQTTEPAPAQQTPAMTEPAPSTQAPADTTTSTTPAVTDNSAAPMSTNDSLEREPRADRN